MITAADTAVYGALRQSGASPLEAVIVLAAAREVDEAIELVGPKGYTHGWVKAGGPAAPGRTKFSPYHPSETGGVSAHHIQRKVRQNRQAAQKALAEQAASSAAASHAQVIMQQTQQKIDEANKALADAQDKRASKDARKKLAGHVGVLVASGVLAAIEAKLGAPGVAAAISGIAPPVIQELYDFKNKL